MEDEGLGRQSFLASATTRFWKRGGGAPGPGGAEFFCQLKPGCDQIRCEHARPGQLQEAREHQADGALAGHEHDIAAQQGQAADRLEDGVDGFEHGAFLERISRRNFHHAGQHERQHAHKFGVAAAGRFETGGDAGAFVGGALSERAVAAEMAVQAGHVMVERHAVADFEFPHALADARDGAGGFVAENARRRHGAVLNFFDVSGADAAHGHLDQQVPRPEARDGHGLQAEVVGPAVNDGAHYGRRFGHVLRAKPERCRRLLTQRRKDAKTQGF